jgi:hypothetical protein
MAFSFTSAAAIEILKPLFLFVIGMVIYSVFVFKFYLFIAKRDIIEFNLKQYSTRARWAWLKKVVYLLLYIVEYILLFPIFVSVWFAVFSILLLLLSRQDISIILLISMAIVTTVRACSYYNEDLSKDLAKMLPFALLGVMLIDINFFSAESLLLGIYKVPSLFDTILYYLIFTIFIEFILRLFALIFKPSVGPEEFSPKGV